MNPTLESLNLPAGTVVHAEIRDPVGPDGIDWVRNPSTANTAPNSGYNGSRFVQTRTWTVGETTVTAAAPAAEITSHSANGQPVTTPAQLEAVVKEAQAAGRTAILLRAQARGGAAVSVPVRLR